MSKPSVVVWLGLVLLTGIGCQKAAEAPPAPPPPGPRVENPQLGLAINQLPGFFKVVVNEGDQLMLEPASGEANARLALLVHPKERYGINLVAASHDYKTAIEAAGGTNYGKDPTEYASPLGTTMYNRARLAGGDAGFDEMAVFVIHPWQDRKLEFRYRYPSSDDPEVKQQRVDQLMEVVGETVGLGEPEGG
ncbi:MAG: hypothetical protein HC897_09465 [Thermoanaerobaculia bacterium]|nr:hypothetical protein [Thermoanaerobaculia bacterium]